MTLSAGAGPAPVPLIDIGAQRRRPGAAIDDAIARVLSHGRFVLGPEVRDLEQRLAEFCGVRHAITTASGTDALRLVLMAWGIGAGDAVLCPAFTFCAAAEVVALLGATPVFIDVEEDTFNLDPAGIAAGKAAAEQRGLNPRAVVPADLFGLPADYAAIQAAAGELRVLSDSAQSFGATFGERRTGALAAATACSFYPSKPLGCYGDGGAVISDDGALIEAVASLRTHGRGENEYDNVRIGLNARLDTIQAAVLLEKLKVFPDEIQARERTARRYSEALGDIVTVPTVPRGRSSVWAYYTVRVAAGRRRLLADRLREQGIETAIYYPLPLPRQPAYREFPVAGNGIPVSERLAGEVISLPMHAYLEESTQDRVIAAVRDALAGS